MQHTIDIKQVGPRGQVMADAIQSCVHCGFCLAACPTYMLLGEEMDSPRGRIYLMKNVLEGNFEATQAEPYIDRCLGCIACVPACPSGVPYNDLLLSYRTLQEEDRERSQTDNAVRSLISETLPYPSRFRWAVRSAKVGRLVKGLLPDEFQPLFELLPSKMKRSKPLPTIYPALGKRRARVALLSGCVQTVMAPDINWATLRVLAANGVETVIPQEQGCCGSILMHTAEEEGALNLARHNLTLFPDDVDAIVTNAAGCGSGMHEYGLLFAGQPEQETAQRFAAKVQDITVFLAELGLVTPPPLPQPLTAVYHDACHLAYAQGVMSQPRELLTAVPNLTLLELNDGGYCCGSAGTYNIEQPDLAFQLGQRKAEHIIKSEAEALITGNIGCLNQIENHLKKMKRPLPLYHTIQILDAAYQN